MIETIINRFSEEEKEVTPLYSPWANADPFLFTNPFSSDSSERETPQKSISKLIQIKKELAVYVEKNNFYALLLPKNSEISFTTTIHDNSQLADELVDELIRREINLSSNGHDHLVLISEWDTFYGRALPASFAMSVQKYREQEKEYADFFKGEFKEPLSPESLSEKIVEDIVAFRSDEFKQPHDIVTLCTKIVNDIDGISPFKNISSHTIDWLNELLQVPDFYDKVKRPVIPFPKDITALAAKTVRFRKKIFPRLNHAEKNAIKLLNRHVLAHIYPDVVPDMSLLPPNTYCKPIDWLNKLLKKPELYDFLRKVKGENWFAKVKKEVSVITQELDMSAQEDRCIVFSRLSEDEQWKIKRLNRLLLEKAYPEETPQRIGAAWPERIHTITYMRGIDGKLPNRDSEISVRSNSGSGEKKGSTTDFDYFNPKFEQPQGQDQFDYMRRLTERVKTIANDRDNIRAIGIMGSDVYDKLLILRALREEFPNAIFFTTDLDARLWHHTERSFTRNLIVASSYGLQLHDTWQKDIPPFRSAYQTSVFVAALQALDRLKEDDIDLKKIPPRIFEIERRDAHDLTSNRRDPGFCESEFSEQQVEALCTKINNDKYLVIPVNSLEDINKQVIEFSGFYDQVKSSKPTHKFPRKIKRLVRETKEYRGKDFYQLSNNEKNQIKTLNRFLIEGLYPDHTPKIDLRKEKVSLHPDRPPLQRNLLIYLFVPPVMILGWLFWQFLPDRHDFRDRSVYRKFKRIWIYFGTIWGVLYLLFVAFAIKSALSADGEPISFLDGMSIWPTELIRFLTGFLGAYFFILFLQHIERNNQEIAGILSAQKGKGFFAHLKKKWDTFEKKSEPLSWRRCLIIGAVAGVHLCIGYVIVFLFGRHLTPGRGSLCFLLDRIILLPSLLCIYFLFWHVVFDTSRCQRFIKGLFQREGNKDDGNYWYVVIKVIAKRTEVPAKTVKYPFILLLFLCVARYDGIDHWKWTAPLVGLVVLSILILLYIAIMLFHEAKLGRQKVVDQLRDKLLKLMAYKKRTRNELNKKESEGEGEGEFTRFIIEDIQNITNGAFATWRHNPILFASLTPLGGVGIISLLQHFFQ